MLQEISSALSRMQSLALKNSPSIILGLTFLILFIILGSYLRNFTRNRLMNRIEDLLLVNFIARMVFLLVVVLGIVIFLNQVGLDKAAGGLLAGAGVSAIIIGFAFKDIGENFLAGFFLAISRPFSIGDIIEVDSFKGIAVALSFRNTHIRTFDGKDIFLPNAMLLKNPLTNYTRDGILRYDFVLGIDYGDDILAAGEVISDTLMAHTRIEQEGDLKPFILLEDFGTSTVNIRIHYWVNSLNFSGHIAELQTEVMVSVIKALMTNGFSLPADIVELKIYQEGSPIPIRIERNSKPKPN